MSRVLVQDMMPDGFRLLERAPGGLLEILLPQDCEFVPFSGPDVYMAFPTLLPLAAAGAMIGFWGWRRLRDSNVFYRRALLWFGCMNLAAIGCHCFTPTSSPLKPLLVALDVGFTCCSASCLCLGALCGGTSTSNNRTHELRANLLPPAVLAVAIAGNYYRAIPFLNELMYIFTTMAAAVLVWCKEGTRPDLSRQQRHALLAAATCYCLFFPAASQLSCHLPGQVDVVNMLFLCCDLSFWFVLRFLLLRQQQPAAGAGGMKVAQQQQQQQHHHFKVARWME